MSENKSDDWFVDPNSGAAPQPGGFVQYGESSVMPEAAGSDTPQVPDNDPEFEAKQSDPEAGKVEGEPAGTTEGQPQGDPEEVQGDGSGDGGDQAEAGDGDGDGGDADADATADQGDAEEESAKDYSELLSGNVPAVQKYIDENPSEKDAVIAAEKAGKNRTGIVEY